jgi:hypothetical protein
MIQNTHSHALNARRYIKSLKVLKARRKEQAKEDRERAALRRFDQKSIIISGRGFNGILI